MVLHYEEDIFLDKVKPFVLYPLYVKQLIEHLIIFMKFMPYFTIQSSDLYFTSDTKQVKCLQFQLLNLQVIL